MEENQESNTSQPKKRNKYLRIAAIVFGVLLSLQVILYFGADFLLRNYLKEKVNQVSENKYEIEFGRFHILFLQFGFSFDGLKIYPVGDPDQNLSETPFFDISLEEIRITGLNYRFRKKEFVIGSIELIRPEVDFRLPIRDSLSVSPPSESPMEVLQAEIKKSFLNSTLKEIRINRFKIEKADLLMRDFISQNEIKAVNTRILLEDIQLLNPRLPETPFNARGFSLGFDDFKVLLADSIHTILAGSVEVSSLEQVIAAKKIQIIPDFDKFANTYFQLELDELKLVDADINKVFYTKEVEVGELNIRRPQFNIYTKVVEKKKNGNSNFDLYDLVDGILESIHIRDFEIREGKFAKRLADEPRKFSINSERIDLKMADFYVGPDEERKENQFFYADDASVKMYKVDLTLNDSIHYIAGDLVSMSSFDDQISVEGFKFFPVQGFKIDLEQSYANIQIPYLNIKDANLKKIYNKGIVDLNEVLIQKPDILLKNITGKDPDKESASDFQRVYSEFLDGIYIKRFEIQDGSLTIDSDMPVREDSLSFGSVNLVLEDFALDAETEKSDDAGIFLAKNLQLELKDYALKLADNLHIFKADRVFLDTKMYLIAIDGFAIKPLYQNNMQAVLNAYGKSTSLDIYVPKFIVNGVNIPQAYFDGILKIQKVTIPSPDIQLFRYKSKESAAVQNELSRGEVMGLLTNYFSEIQVDSIKVQKAKLNYQNFSSGKTKGFTEDNLNLSVKNFNINENTLNNEINGFFSEEIDLKLNNYVFNIGNGKYSIEADGINFNTSKEEINARNVRINPGSGFSGKTKITAIVPVLSLQGVDLDAFLFDNTLNLQKLGFEGTSVALLVDRDFERISEKAERQRARERQLPKNIGIVSVDTIESIDAKFSLGYKEQGVQTELINTQINLSVFDFLLDSASMTKGEIAGFFGGVAVDLDEFWLTLNDSIHRVTFSNVDFDTKNEAILLNNFRVIPRDLSGKPGIPVFSGHVPSISVNFKSLVDMEASKELWLTKLTLTNPDLEIFLDEVKATKNEKQIAEAGKEIFESLRLDEFKIEDGNFSIFDKNSSKPSNHFNGVNFALQKTNIDLTKLEDLDKNDFLKQDFNFSITDYEILLKDSLNKIKIGLLTLDRDRIRLEDVYLIPRVGLYEYGRTVGNQTDVANLHIPLLVVDKPDYIRVLDSDVLAAKSLTVSDVNATIFRDKRYPRKEGIFRPMPQELMRNAGVELRLDTFVIDNATIRYIEFFEKGMVPGELFFTEVNAGLYPFYLGKSENEIPLAESFLLATAKMNGVADLNLQGTLHFEDPYPMGINAQLGAFEMNTLNSILESNAFVNVKRGTVNSADWSFVADNEKAIGQMEFLYSDLRLVLLNNRTLKPAKGRNAILTFVLNSFAVRSNNPRRYLRKPINGKIYQERDQEKFIFNYWWKTTFSGIKGSLGLGQAKPPKAKKRKNSKDAIKKED